jgi:hypothetical protein
VLAIVAAATIASSIVVTRAAFGAPDRPTMKLSTQRLAPGDDVAVTLDGWKSGVVVVSVCGNRARRGSRDCDLPGAESVRVVPTGPTTTVFRVGVPPVGCPCVVRVADAVGESTVRALPIVLDGVADGPVLDDAGSAAPNLEVTATVSDADRSWPASWLPLVAGPTARSLAVRVENAGNTDVSGIRVAAVVGRDRHSGEPVGTRVIAHLAPGERRRVVLRFELPTPAYGEYVVYGTASATNSATDFAAETSNDPWALELLLPVVLLVLAMVLRRREQARKQREAAAALARALSFRQCSPDVGGNGSERSGAPSYDSAVPDPIPARADTEAVGR